MNPWHPSLINTDLEGSSDDSSVSEATESCSSLSLPCDDGIQHLEEATPEASFDSAKIVQTFAKQPSSLNSGYKLVFDNIDKNVKPRYMRCDAQTQSLHYVQVYGVKDRIDYSSFTSEQKTEIEVFSILPNSEDYDAVKKIFTVLISRIMHKHLAFFGDDFKKLIPQHIRHEYSAEMSTKSEVVSAIFM